MYEQNPKKKDSTQKMDNLSSLTIYQKAILRFQNLMDIYISIYISVSYFLEFLFEEIRDVQTKVCDMLQRHREKI